MPSTTDYDAWLIATTVKTRTHTDLHAVIHSLVHRTSIIIIITSPAKVIWEEGRVAAKVSPHWLQWRASNSTPKVPLPVDRFPNPTTRLIPGPVRPIMPNGIRIRSAVFHNALDRPTHVQTDRSSTGKFDDYSPLRFERERRGLIIITRVPKVIIWERAASGRTDRAVCGAALRPSVY